MQANLLAVINNHEVEVWENTVLRVKMNEREHAEWPSVFQCSFCRRHKQGSLKDCLRQKPV